MLQLFHHSLTDINWKGLPRSTQINRIWIHGCWLQEESTTEAVTSCCVNSRLQNTLPQHHWCAVQTHVYFWDLLEHKRMTDMITVKRLYNIQRHSYLAMWDVKLYSWIICTVRCSDFVGTCVLGMGILSSLRVEGGPAQRVCLSAFCLLLVICGCRPIT